VKVVTKAQKVTIPVVARPKPVQLSDVQVHVVTEKNLDEFIKKFTAENGELAVVAMSMRDYENLALNISELRRFILQSTDFIVYYEDAVKPEEAKPQQQDNGSTILNFFK
jgi:tRNA threonylcarbamoyladenosine modification (KEOPS) complex Cgi121 subunit